MKYILLLLLTIQVSADVEKFPITKLNHKMLYSHDGSHWGFTFISKDELLITVREGKVLYFKLGTKKPVQIHEFKNLYDKNQGGLLDIKKHKDFIYLTYSKKINDEGTTALMRATFNRKTKKLESIKDLFVAQAKEDGGRHFGSRLFFKDDSIFMSVGERGQRDKSQSLKTHHGKILRLTLEGRAHSDNKIPSALPEIYSYGHRNPQGLCEHPKSGALLEAEFGPRGGDELNLIEQGKNYGWPVITYGKEYYGPSIGPTHKEGMEQPLTYWVPSISPSACGTYTGSKIPQFKDSVFLANLSGTHLRQLIFKGNKIVKQISYFHEKYERIRNVQMGPDENLYFTTDSGDFYVITGLQK